MKKFFLLFFVIAAISCTKDRIVEDSRSASVETKSVDGFALTDKDSLFTFDKITEPSNWRTYESFDEMVEACQIPESLLDSLSTEALYKLCVEYPLGPSCFLFNDSSFGLDKMLEAFNGYSEMQRRLSARSYAPDKLKKFSVEFDKFINANVAEDAPLKAKYKQLLDNKLFGESKYVLNTKTVASILSTNITVRTPYGKPVDAISGMGDLTEAEYDYMVAYINSMYPNAVILGDATKDYNCHGYAWCMASGGPTCWINCGTSSTDVSNISKYWSSDAYKSTTIENDAVKIHYYNSDHSAIKSTVPGYYESKWGSWCLMRHAPNYCPYGTDRHYYEGALYRIRYINGEIYEIPMGETKTFCISPCPTAPNSTWSWDVTSDKTGDSIVGQYATITYNTSAGYPSANITINKVGAYDIVCVFSNSYQTTEWRYSIFVEL